MPLIVDRRSFLRQTTGAFALAAGLSKTRAAESSGLRIALLSDTHISADRNDKYRGFSPFENLSGVADKVGKDRFDLAVVNGDLARLSGEPVDYAQFTSLVRPITERIPTVMTLGNHDNRGNARNALTNLSGKTQVVDQKLVSTLETGPVSFVLLDSLLATNIAPGQVGKLQREWLTTYLDANAAKRLIVFVHHNPDPDSDNALVDAERLLAILRPRRAVKALIFGHTHVYKAERQDGLHLLNLPAVGYNFADGNPVGWVDATFTDRGGTLKLNAIAGERRDDGKAMELAWR